MAELLKNWFNKEFIEALGRSLNAVDSSFEVKSFVSSVLDKEWEGRELKDRMRHITHCLNGSLDTDYVDAIKQLSKVADQFDGLTAMVFPDYVEVYGLDDFDTSLEALELFTKYSSSEFAIRPFILEDAQSVIKRMLEWSKHENHHVRRFSSEGCRPRLPWAIALPDFKSDPSMILPILENLKDDESEYVRKSVANNINDISKDNPEIAIDLARRWYGKSKNTDWIVKHGMRGLLKNGNKAALEIFGFNENADVSIPTMNISHNKVNIGGNLDLNFSVAHKEENEVFLKVAYAIDYVKSNGSTSNKIFHVTEKTFIPGKEYPFKKKISFKELTTRKHYPGSHTVHVVVNGKQVASKDFVLEPAQ